MSEIMIWTYCHAIGKHISTAWLEKTENEIQEELGKCEKENRIQGFEYRFLTMKIHDGNFHGNELFHSEKIEPMEMEVSNG